MGGCGLGQDISNLQSLTGEVLATWPRATRKISTVPWRPRALRRERSLAQAHALGARAPHVETRRLIEDRLEEFAQLESLDNGKPVVMARLADIPVSVDTLRYYAGWATKVEGNTIPLSMQPGGKFLAYTLREPVGVVGQIIPWNFPLVMATLKLGPALAVGCTVILKLRSKRLSPRCSWAS